MSDDIAPDNDAASAADAAPEVTPEPAFEPSVNRLPQLSLDPEPEAAPEADAAPDEVAQVEAEDSAETFPRKVVEELRNENASWRQRAQALQALEAEPAELDFFTGIIGLYANPETRDQAVQALYDATRGYLGIENDAAPASAPESNETDGAPDKQFLTLEDLQAFEAQRAEEAAQRQIVEEIHNEARTLGYEVGSDSYDELMLYAGRIIDADPSKAADAIQLAHAAIEDRNQSIVSRYLEGKSADAAKFPPVAPTLGSGAVEAETPKTFKAAGEAAAAALRGRL